MLRWIVVVLLWLGAMGAVTSGITSGSPVELACCEPSCEGTPACCDVTLEGDLAPASALGDPSSLMVALFANPNESRGTPRADELLRPPNA